MLMASLVFSLSACEDDDSDSDSNQNPSENQQTIAEIAGADANFSILVDALTRTNLLGTVSDANANLTVFAPTDAAFSDLLMELQLADLDAVEQAVGNDGLKNILLYHVLGAEVKSGAVSTGYASTAAVNSTNDALSLFINTDGGVRINNRADVDQFDVDASNGVIHVIDKVLLPATVGELIIWNAAQFSSLTTALGAADGDLDDLVTDPEEDEFTLFAPDDAAFASLVMELQVADLAAVVAAVGTDGLADILLYHVIAGNVNADEVSAGSVATAQTESITISTTGGVTITDARNRMATVTQTDIQGTNGVAHVINKVILPMP